MRINTNTKTTLIVVKNSKTGAFLGLKRLDLRPVWRSKMVEVLAYLGEIEREMRSTCGETFELI